MNENKYYVTVNNRSVAENVTLEYALIFTKAIFEHYYNDHDMVISIQRLIISATTAKGETMAKQLL